MGKTNVYVIVFVVVLGVTFGILCYLMAFVNPPAMYLETSTTSVPKANNNIIHDDNDTIHDDNDTTHDGGLRALYHHLKKKVNPELQNETSCINKTRHPHKDNIDQSILYSLTSLKPNSLEQPTSWNPNINKTAQNVTSNVTKFDHENDSSKGRRRSINELKKEIVADKSGIVNLKIIDRIGYPRIEIKLHTNQFLNKVNDSLNLQIQNIDQDIVQLNQDTVIRILPNNSIFVESNLGNKSDFGKSYSSTRSTIGVNEPMNNVGEYRKQNKERNILYRNKVGPNETDFSVSKSFVNLKNEEELNYVTLLTKSTTPVYQSPGIIYETDDPFGTNDIKATNRLKDYNEDLYNIALNLDTNESNDTIIATATYNQVFYTDTSTSVNKHFLINKTENSKDLTENSAFVTDITQIIKPSHNDESKMKRNTLRPPPPTRTPFIHHQAIDPGRANLFNNSNIRNISMKNARGIESVIDLTPDSMVFNNITSKKNESLGLRINEVTDKSKLKDDNNDDINDVTGLDIVTTVNLSTSVTPKHSQLFFPATEKYSNNTTVVNTSRFNAFNEIKVNDTVRKVTITHKVM